MNYPRIVLAAIAAWIVSIGLGYLINNVWLLRLYQANAWAFRRQEEIMPLLPIGFGLQLLAFFAFAFAYAKGYEGEGSHIGEGVRYGLIVAIMIDGFAVVWNYVTQPIAPRLGILQMLAVIAELGICGAIVGLAYHPSRIRVPRADETYDLRG